MMFRLSSLIEIVCMCVCMCANIERCMLHSPTKHIPKSHWTKQDNGTYSHSMNAQPLAIQYKCHKNISLFSSKYFLFLFFGFTVRSMFSVCLFALDFLSFYIHIWILTVCVPQCLNVINVFLSALLSLCMFGFDTLDCFFLKHFFFQNRFFFRLFVKRIYWLQFLEPKGTDLVRFVFLLFQFFVVVVAFVSFLSRKCLGYSKWDFVY